MEKVEIRKIIEDIIITQFLNSEMDIVHEEDVTFKELGLHLGLIEEIKAAFIDFLPAETVLLSALLITIF